MIRPETNVSLLNPDDDVLAALTDQQQAKLASILETYLDDLELGREVNKETLIQSHPSLATALTKYLQSVEALFRAGMAVATDDLSGDTTGDYPLPTGERTLPRSSQVGDYQITHEIGRGGMGVVYAARQISLQRTVALKTLPFAAVLDQKQVARFKNEAQAAAGLHHPNIVPVYGVGCERGVHYFSMQLIEGQSLEQAIVQLKEGGVAKATVSPNKSTDNHFSTQKSIRSREFTRSVARLGRQAAAAVHHAHEHGVVHRDIKPSNLLLDADGKLWVSDFGLARIASASNLTVSGDMIGTARYMSPEQAAGRLQEIDHRTDIYSLGITLYELLTLHPAFDADTRLQLLRAVEHETPIAPRQLNPSIPVDLETIVLKAIEKDRGNRYASAAELEEDLGHFLDGRPTRAKRPGVREQAFRWANRHRNIVTAAAAAMLLALLFVSTSALMIQAERNKTRMEADRAAFHLRETQRVVDNFGAMVDQRLEHLPASSSLRADLLGELEKYYSAFLARAGGDQSFATDLAITRFRLAAVHQRMGNYTRAAAGYHEALTGFEQFRDESPGNVDRLADIALCHNNLGQVAAKLGDAENARAEYENAIATYKDLLALGHHEGASGLGRSQMNLGLLLSSIHDPDAMGVLTGACETLASLAAESPDDLRLLDQLALCENNLASVLLTSDAKRAEKLLHSALARYERLVSERPGSPEHRSDQALALGNLAAVIGHRGDRARASEMYREVIKVRQALVDLEPGIPAHQHDLVTAYEQMGQLLAGSSDWEEASTALDRAAVLLRVITERTPGDHSSLSHRGRTLAMQALTEARRGDRSRALELMDQAVSQQQQAIDLSPDSESYQELLAHHHRQIVRLNTLTDSSITTASN